MWISLRIGFSTFVAFTLDKLSKPLAAFRTSQTHNAHRCFCFVGQSKWNPSVCTSKSLCFEYKEDWPMPMQDFLNKISCRELCNYSNQSFFAAVWHNYLLADTQWWRQEAETPLTIQVQLAFHITVISVNFRTHTQVHRGGCVRNIWLRLTTSYF